MKRYAFIASVMVLGAGMALASSLNVPFFLDTAPSDGNFPPSPDGNGNTTFATFVALHNNTSDDILVEVDYFDAGQDGSVDHQTPTNNTFSLPANATWGFRPVGDDAATEVGNAGFNIPNMPGGETAGSATLSWAGGPAAIQGRAFQIDSAGNTFGFLLPPGF